MDNVILTDKEAYRAMLFFLDQLQQRTNSDDLASHLGDMDINRSTGKSMDPAMWEDWMKAIQKVKQ